MVCRIKDVAGQVWDDCVTCARLFTSFCMVIGSGIMLINSAWPGTLSDFPVRPTSKVRS